MAAFHGDEYKTAFLSFLKPPIQPLTTGVVVGDCESLDAAASTGCTIEVMISMTVEEIQALVSSQCAGNLTVKNDHRIGLEQAIVPPHRTLVVWRMVENGNLKDTELSVWVVGQENSSDGYKIIMRDDGEQFGLASVGFPSDKHLILDGWYGSLLSAFLAM